MNFTALCGSNLHLFSFIFSSLFLESLRSPSNCVFEKYTAPPPSTNIFTVCSYPNASFSIASASLSSYVFLLISIISGLSDVVVRYDSDCGRAMYFPPLKKPNESIRRLLFPSFNIFTSTKSPLIFSRIRIFLSCWVLKCQIVTSIVKIMAPPMNQFPKAPNISQSVIFVPSSTTDVRISL